MDATRELAELVARLEALADSWESGATHPEHQWALRIAASQVRSVLAETPQIGGPDAQAREAGRVGP